MTVQDDLHEGRGWLNRASDVLTGAEDSMSAAEYARVAAMLGSAFIQLAHTTRSLAAQDEVSKVRQTILTLSDEPEATLGEAIDQERAVAEARPHDDKPVLGDVIKCQQCGQQTRSISRGCSVCGLGMARLDEPGKDAGHVWMPYPDEPGRRCTCSIGHDHDEDPSDGPSQAQEVRAAADWPAEPVGDRYDELAADRHAEITEAEASEGRDRG